MIVEKTMYSSDACQQFAWKRHTVACKKFKTRKQLYRAGKLVQDAFLAYRENAFDLNIVKVEKRGRISTSTRVPIVLWILCSPSRMI